MKWGIRDLGFRIQVSGIMVQSLEGLECRRGGFRKLGRVGQNEHYLRGVAVGGGGRGLNVITLKP